MSVNPSSLKYNTINYNRSVPDTKEINSIISDDESSYVLFNPVNSESDILSFTNSARTEDNISQRNEGYDDKYDDEEINPDYTTPSLDKLNDNYNAILEGESSNRFDRISNWNIDDEELVDDNIASWNLDEKIASSSLVDREFYGDELFRNFSKKDLQKFREFHIRNKLTSNDKNLINQILMKLVLRKNDLPHETLFRREGGLSQRTNDYVNSFNNSLEFSDTTSSVVLCGGPGSGSWNDI